MPNSFLLKKVQVIKGLKLKIKIMSNVTMLKYNIIYKRCLVIFNSNEQWAKHYIENILLLFMLTRMWRKPNNLNLHNFVKTKHCVHYKFALSQLFVINSFSAFWDKKDSSWEGGDGGRLFTYFPEFAPVFCLPYTTHIYAYKLAYMCITG